MLLAGTLAVLVLGGVPAQTATTVAPPPCHEAMAEHGAPAKPHHAPDKAMKSMACCVACVAGLETPVVRTMAQRSVVPVSDRVHALPTGRMPAPEHGPPKD